MIYVYIKVVEHGYEWFGKNKRLITIFSAPDYCGEFDNEGGYMSLNSNSSTQSENSPTTTTTTTTNNNNNAVGIGGDRLGRILPYSIEFPPKSK